ncbi:hypothetical protein [Burkholderia cenocepacia]|uniref:hypothetical protein n=1 Tax=Burkholderia cenocepacia TaxID=95486 RepID=UPI002237C4EC|nr:hypothetical protein [Burkholderia cenocepacia]MCW5185329.1 hypothetical protein [Burkholderia cenocepacia]
MPFEDLVGDTHLTVGWQFEGQFDNGGLDLRIWFYRKPAWVRISAMVINRFGERDQSGRWCCAVNGL